MKIYNDKAEITKFKLCVKSTALVGRFSDFLVDTMVEEATTNRGFESARQDKWSFSSCLRIRLSSSKTNERKHMRLGGCPNPSKMEQCWERTLVWVLVFN